MRFTLFCLILLISPVIAHSATINIPADYIHIQEGIDAASNGDTVLVAPGFYMQVIDFKGKAITVKSSSGANVTIIDGFQAASVVTFVSGEGKDSLLEGFTITNGLGSHFTLGYGGGIHCDASSPTISNNIIISNQAKHSGGGIRCYNGSPIIVNNIIANNIAQYFGGGLYYEGGSPVSINNTITGNRIYQTMGKGGGLFCLDSSGLITNTIFWNNIAYSGHEIAMDSLYKPSLLSVSYSDIEGGLGGVAVNLGCTLNWGAGMIDADPLFVNSGIGDCHLTYNSPCRDAASNSIPGIPFADFEGDPRLPNNAKDMGADEFHTHLYFTGNPAPGGSVEVKLIGVPGANPVILWVGSGVLPAPIPTIYGDWRLDFPMLLTLGFGSIPSPDGVVVLPYAFDHFFPPDIDIPMQALIGMSLTNLCVMHVR